MTKQPDQQFQKNGNQISLDPMETEEDLQRLCLEWQKRLRLNDWRIKIRWADPGEIDTQGNVTWVSGHPDARIILQPLEYDKLTDRDPLEKTLIHELLHLHYWWLTRNSDKALSQVENDLAEQAIDKSAWAFLELKYQVNEGDLDFNKSVLR